MKQILGMVLILCLSFPLPALAQKREGQLTIKEMQETKQLMAKFEKRLEETLDVEQALQGVSGNDWFENVFRETKRSKGSDLSAIGIEQQLLISHKQEYRRAMLAVFNLTYLMLVHGATQDYEEDNDVDFAKLLPPDVLAILRTNPYWAAAFAAMNSESSNDEAVNLKTISELMAVLLTAERATEILRARLQALNVKDKRALQLRMSEGKSKMNSEPHLHICNEECASLPNGTRTAVMDYLLFQLTFAKVGNEMKLVLIASRLGE